MLVSRYSEVSRCASTAQKTCICQAYEAVACFSMFDAITSGYDVSQMQKCHAMLSDDTEQVSPT